MKDLRQSLHITPITAQYEEVARQLILDGLEERFGFLDHSFNPDLKDIMRNYTQGDAVFLIGLAGNEVVCTGALTRESGTAGRIQRMSVKKSHRREGLAELMLQQLEKKARQAGYRSLKLETNNEWHSAVSFYTKMGYQVDWKDEERSHFVKRLDQLRV
ncbi:GNAT family N-acetyltransferase [Planococcus beigongshangi]|uniref:GNAT family N-acetyltransferase n=1 Tax=Planococcus beigongshangi TaxID=2782536 RepID=UPI00193C3A8B|nr:GNAT family N-acetyltransferase [Planococcus beigongshangi]